MDKLLKMLKSRTIKNLIYYVGNAVLRILYLPLCLFPIKNNQIAIINYGGKGYGDNPKYVVNQILEENHDTKIIWLVSKIGNQFPDGIDEVKLYSLKGLKCFATSKVWVSNARLPLFLVKRKKQVYYQLWHGGCGPKRIEAAANNLIAWYISAAKHDSKMIDYCVSNSDFNSKIFAEDFWYEGEILKYGSPRHDIFFNMDQELKSKVKAKLGIEENCRIILYAPTFRDNKDYHIYQWNYDAVRNAVKEKMGGDWCFVLRLHPNISFLASEFQYGDAVKNGSSYDDMQELISASDILITDYSGTMMQAALAKKVVLIYASDESQYLHDRGLCIDIDRAPFPKSADVDGMTKNIKQLDMAEYDKSLNLFLEPFHFYDDGKASQRVADKIIENITA